MISIDEVLAILRAMKEEAEELFDTPNDKSEHAFGYARGVRHAVRTFEDRLRDRIEALSTEGDMNE